MNVPGWLSVGITGYWRHSDGTAAFITGRPSKVAVYRKGEDPIYLEFSELNGEDFRAVVDEKYPPRT